MVEAQPDLFTHLREAARVSVDDALRLSGGAGGVENERPVLRIERGGGERRRLRGQEFAPLAYADYFYAGRNFLRQREPFPAPRHVVRCEQQPRTAIFNPRGNSPGAESGKDRHHRQACFEAPVENRKDFRNHRHAQRHTVTRLQSERDQSVGYPVRFVAQFPERDAPRRAAFAFPDTGNASGCPPSGPDNCARC